MTALTPCTEIADVDLLRPGKVTCCGLEIESVTDQNMKDVVEIRDVNGTLYGRLINLYIPEILK